MTGEHLSKTATVDSVFIFITVTSVIILALVTSLMVFFLLKYNRKKNPVAKDIESNLALEIVWIVIPTIIVLAMFYYGWSGFRVMRNPPADAAVIRVEARMWSWLFMYENGRRSNTLNVPAGRPVKLVITSKDVIHSLSIPAFRVKEDAVPGMETYLWFLPDKVGAYDLYCTEYCGTGHHSMTSKVVVMTEEDFRRWYGQKEKPAGAEKALSVMEDYGCLECHSVDGSRKIGPTLKGIFGKDVVVVTEGRERSVMADEGYIRKSLMSPDADIVKGYPPIMPSQEGVLVEEEIEEIILYIKDLK